jgi:hypothetical protein
MRTRWAIFGTLIAVGIVVWLAMNPPRPLLNVLKRVDPSPETGARLVERYGCRRCHRIGDSGGGGALRRPLSAFYTTTAFPG